MSLLVAAVVGYAVGSVSFATLLARRRGVDLRASGSGNPGATNIGRVLGRKAGIAVALADVAKGLVPAALFGLVLHDAGLVAGVAATFGHVTSPLLHGRGGKGVATAGGAILGSHPAWGPLVIVVWLLVVLLTRWVALGSSVAALSVPVFAALLTPRRGDLVWSAALAAIVVARHRRNFVRRWTARRGA
ncbi:MAG: glycerol-3-phosphate acyltransferase [Mycobacteriales bacterium]